MQGEIPTDILQTFQFMSDGKDIFWLYGIQTQETLTNPISGDKIKQHPVYLHTIHIKVCTQVCSTSRAWGWEWWGGGGCSALVQ